MGLIDSWVNSVKRRMAMNFLSGPVRKAVEWAGAGLVAIGAIQAAELGQFVDVNTAAVLGLAGLALTWAMSKLGKKV